MGSRTAREYRRSRRTRLGNRPRRGWREAGWPRGIRPKVATAGPSAGHHRRTASSGYGRQQEGKRKQRFTALLHHVYDVDRLRSASLALNRDAAAGIDGQTWRQYGEALEANLQDLSARIQRAAFRASPVRRAYIPKADGRQRPLGVPTLEDKIAQRAVVEVLNAIYEQDFLGFS